MTPAAATPTAGVRSSRRQVLAAAAGAAGAALTACASPRAGAAPAPVSEGAGAQAAPRWQEAPPPEEVASPPEEADARAAADAEALRGIRALLDRQAAARNALDRTAYMSTIDQRNLVWRRIQGDYFDLFAADGRRPPQAFRVTRVAPKQNGYYKAWIDAGPAGSDRVTSQAVWVFRPTEGGWLHSEILNEEIGPRQVLDTEHFRLSYYAWDDDVVERTGMVAERAYAHVTAALAAAPAFKATLSLNPTFGSHSGLREFGVWAAYLPDTKNTVISRSMESFGAGTTDPGETQDDRLLVALTHEYAHLVNDQIVPLVKLPPWMSEGLAEYVAQNTHADLVGAALRAGKLLPLDKANEAIEWGRDPAKGYTQFDILLAYGEAAHAVTYYMERFGMDKFFDLARTYADSRKWDDAMRQVTGISAADFEAGWLEWLRRRLGT